MDEKDDHQWAITEDITSLKLRIPTKARPIQPKESDRTDRHQGYYILIYRSHDRDTSDFFHTIYYVVKSRSRNKVKFYLEELSAGTYF
jgi:hypothetical protein